MRRSPAHDDPADRPAAPFAGLAGALVHLQVLLHRAVAFGRRVVVDRAAAPLHRFGQDVAQSLVEPADVGRPERLRLAERMKTGPPQRFVGVDVAHSGKEVLVQEQRLEPPAPSRDQVRESARREVVGKRLRAPGEDAWRLALDRQPGGRIPAVQPDPPELAHVAEPELAAIVEHEHQVDVAILRRRRGDDEELAGHLEMNRHHRKFRVGRGRAQPDQELLAAPADSFDLASGDAGRELLGAVAAQRFRPVRARAHDPGACHQAAQVSGDRLDFR